MIIALATDDRSLLVFPSSDAAVTYCEGIDVEDGAWKFWDGSGAPLRPLFSESNKRSGAWTQNGTYTLEPAEHRGLPALAEMLCEPVFLEPNPFFASIEALQAHLASGKAATQHGA